MRVRRKTNDLFSIVIPTCNEGEMLHATVENILQQTAYPRIEVIVVDDGSTDGSCERFQETEDPVTVITSSTLGIPRARNLGAIVRSAHCAGAQALVIPKDRAVGATPTVSKASAGALEHTRLCRVTNLATTIGWLKKKGVWVAGLAMEADRTIYQVDFSGALALVVGGEEKGIRSLIRQNCDMLVSIPQTGRIDSLNASAAGAVAMYEIYRQRHLTRAK